MNVFAIGDIHGCFNQLVALQDKILGHPKFNKNKDLYRYHNAQKQPFGPIPVTEKQ